MGCKKHEPDTTPNSLPCLWPVVAAVTRLTPHSLPSLPHFPHNSLRNAMPVQWVAHAMNTGVVKAPVIAQKCPQEGRVGRREAAARGCPRRQQCGLGFVQASCPLEHTSTTQLPLSAFFLCPPATCQPACCFSLPIATFYVLRVVHYMHLGWFRGPTQVQHKDTHTEQRGCLALQHRK